MKLSIQSSEFVDSHLTTYITICGQYKQIQKQQKHSQRLHRIDRITSADLDGHGNPPVSWSGAGGPVV